MVCPNTDNTKWKHETTLTCICTNQEEIDYLKKNPQHIQLHRLDVDNL